jgi:3-oxoacyl-[acyl-carrier protein] reductase
MSGRFGGRVAIVTGASHEPSIGRATAERLAREGASVVINARDVAALADAERALRREGLEVTAVAGSTEDDATARELVAVARQRYGRIDAVVNTVGGSRFEGTPRTLDRAGLLRTIELNTWGAVALVQQALAGGLADDGGAVVNVSSGTAHKTTPSMIAYSAAKSALNAITRTLARDLAALGVRVNAVAPGLTRTSATRAMWEPDDGEAAGRNLPLGRLTRADDIAAACVFLLSDDARQITGQIIDVDGGNHLVSGGWTPMTDPLMQARRG